MRFAGDALNTLNHDNYGQHTVDGQQRLVEPVQPNSFPQVIDTPAHLTGGRGFDMQEGKFFPQAPSIGEDADSRKQYNRMQQRPAAPGLDPSQLQQTPELTPSGFTNPFHQEKMMDQYIRKFPGSGVG